MLKWVLLFLSVPYLVFAYVYVYEVVTEANTFQTASKLTPVDFYMYNGGKDIIYDIKVLKIYKTEDFNKAVEDFGLRSRNVKFLPHTPPAKDNKTEYKRMIRPYFWWR